jgi:hypothetical protein
VELRVELILLFGAQLSVVFHQEHSTAHESATNAAMSGDARLPMS